MNQPTNHGLVLLYRCTYKDESAGTIVFTGQDTQTFYNVNKEEMKKFKLNAEYELVISLESFRKRHHKEEPCNERYSELGTFGAIGNAAADFKWEADRIATAKSCNETITCGELDKILEDTRHATKQLKRIKVTHNDQYDDQCNATTKEECKMSNNIVHELKELGRKSGGNGTASLSVETNGKLDELTAEERKTPYGEISTSPKISIWLSLANGRSQNFDSHTTIEHAFKEAFKFLKDHEDGKLKHEEEKLIEGIVRDTERLKDLLEKRKSCKD